jgi:hypothetical protein
MLKYETSSLKYFLDILKPNPPHLESIRNPTYKIEFWELNVLEWYFLKNLKIW